MGIKDGENNINAQNIRAGAATIGLNKNLMTRNVGFGSTAMTGIPM